ncbi:hypothetical protein FZEAL_1770 [Fusarium zealandicum]|uniref:Uncharacterized protein n=1 Tax=Fusarium zealandicum TaxID=1053134 RepID=A0A8H4USP0_9HYPO|nr:hypothetical protein FZEAL_1770 [Fusarium zealandicum]
MSTQKAHGKENRPAFQPQCTHLTMTRLYDEEAICVLCQEPGPLGWVYRCTQDREEMIAKKQLSPADYIYNDFVLVDQIGVRKGSPEARQDKLSFFKEVTPKQLAKYRPDQIATILRQREDLKAAITKEEFKKSSAALFSSTGSPPPGFEVFTNDNIYAGKWTCGEQEECQYMVCSRCRPTCADRAFLSLGAVADGEIPPTAAVGFGFGQLGGRPICNGEILKAMEEDNPIRICLEPSTRQVQPEVDSGVSCMTERLMRQILDETIARIHVEDARWRADGRSEWPLAEHEARASLRRTSRQVLERVNTVTPVRESRAAVSQSRHNQRGLDDPTYFTPTFACPRERSRRRRLTERIMADNPPSSPPAGYVHRSLDADNSDQAAPLFHSDESRDTSSQATGRDDNGDEITPAPLRVDRGIAFTEESIETGIPDVVTQV